MSLLVSGRSWLPMSRHRLRGSRYNCLQTFRGRCTERPEYGHVAARLSHQRRVIVTSQSMLRAPFYSTVHVSDPIRDRLGFSRAPHGLLQQSDEAPRAFVSVEGTGHVKKADPESVPRSTVALEKISACRARRLASESHSDAKSAQSPSLHD